MDDVNHLLVVQSWAQIFLNPLILSSVALFVMFLLLMKFINTNGTRNTRFALTSMSYALLIGLPFTTATADQTTPLLETNNSKSNTPKLPSPASSKPSALTPEKSIEKKSMPTKKVHQDAKLKAAIDPAQATATTPATAKPKKSSVNIKVKVGNITNTNGSINIGVIESKKKKTNNMNKSPGRISQ